MVLSPESNRKVFDDVAGQYLRDRALDPAERALLVRYRGRWDQTDVLDLGVGAGRTAYTLAAVARRYVGMDYSEAMIRLARELIGEDDRTKFVHGDARDLSSFYGQAFDVVLFSFNGIDYVPHDDRQRVFEEVRRVIAPDGCFAFSSHSLDSLPFRVTPDRLDDHSGIVQRAVYLARATANTARAIAINRSLDLPAARARGWALVRDSAHRFRLATHYTTPACQLRQLEAAGFRNIEVLDRSGNVVRLDRPPADSWLYYHCEP